MIKSTFGDWGTIRKKGKFRFFLVNGVILYGLPMFVFMAFVTDPFANGLASRAAIVHCALWPIAGLLFGILMWYYGEYRFHHGPDRNIL